MIMNSENEPAKIDLDAIFGPRHERGAAAQRRARLLAGRTDADPDEVQAAQESAAFESMVSGYAAKAVERLGSEFLIRSARSLQNREDAEACWRLARTLCQEVLDNLVQTGLPLLSPRDFYLALAFAVRRAVLNYARQGPREQSGIQPPEAVTFHMQARGDDTIHSQAGGHGGTFHVQADDTRVPQGASDRQRFVESANRLDALVQSRAPDYASAYLLHYFGGRTVPEVARLVGQNESAVKGRIMSILAELIPDEVGTPVSP
jgi:hypothetical protein